MISMLAGWFISAKISERFARPAAIATIVTGIAAILYFGGGMVCRAIGASAVEEYEAKIEMGLERSGRKADQNIVNRQAARSVAQVSNREEFNNATIYLDKEGLSCRQRIDICNELRDAGTDTSSIPQCVNICAGKEANSEPKNNNR